MDGQIQRYKAYLTVAHSLSFTEAAQALGYSQSAVSRLVAELEREWDVQLFERSRAGVRLTNVGQQLLPAAKAICQAESEFRTQVENIHNLSAGTIRIGTISSIATHWLPRIVAAFQADYPGINYELFLGDYTQLAEALDNGRIDCAFTRLPIEGAFNALPLEQDELMAILPETHPLAHEASLSPELLAQEAFIQLKQDDNDEVAEVFEACRRKPQAHFTTWDDYAVMSMVEAGLGVSVLPSLILTRAPYRIVAVPLNPHFYRTLGFVTRKTAVVPLAVQRFMRYLDKRNAS